MSSFRFKQFKVAHDRCSHKVGTDGVLLGCWVQIRERDRLLLDIGTGSGLIALMLAQRAHPVARIDAVEIHAPDAEQARENILGSPWPDRINLHHLPVQSYFPGTYYDLIVTNPPYFRNSLLPPDPQRSAARHTHRLPFPDLIETAMRLIAPDGRFALILPTQDAAHFISLCESTGLFPSRRTYFHARADKPAERVLLELSKQKAGFETSQLILNHADGTWSDEYTALTSEFYIK